MGNDNKRRTSQLPCAHVDRTRAAKRAGTDGRSGAVEPDPRWAIRRSIDLDADLTDSAGMRCTAKVTDISEEGCMIRLPSGRILERHLLHSIKVTGLEALSGYVIWCADGKGGLVFSEPLSPAMVQNLVMKSLYAKISRQVAQQKGPADILPPRAPFPFDN